MKRTLVLAVFLMLFGVIAFAADDSLSRFQGVMNVYSTPSKTVKVYVDNVAKSLQTLYQNGGGTYLKGTAPNTIAPIGVLVSCESANVRWSFGNATTTATDNGHLFPSNSNWHFTGPEWVSTMIGIAASVSDNVVCQITLEY